MYTNVVILCRRLPTDWICREVFFTKLFHINSIDIVNLVTDIFGSNGLVCFSRDAIYKNRQNLLCQFTNRL